MRSRAGCCGACGHELRGQQGRVQERAVAFVMYRPDQPNLLRDSSFEVAYPWTLASLPASPRQRYRFRGGLGPGDGRLRPGSVADSLLLTPAITINPGLSA